MAEKSSKYQQEENVRQYFDQIAQDYSQRYSSSRPYHQYFFTQRLKLATAELDFEGKTILDIGAGTGALYDYLQQKDVNCQYYACDLSKAMLQQSNIPPDRYHIGSINTLPFQETQFDYIFLLGVTTYLSSAQLQQHLLFLSKHLTPSGTATISFTNARSLDFSLRKLLKVFIPKNWHKAKVLHQSFEQNAFRENDLHSLFPKPLIVSKPIYFNFTNTALNHLTPKLSIALAKRLKQWFNNRWPRHFLASDFLVKCHTKTLPSTFDIRHSKFDILNSTFNILQFSYYFPPIKSIGTLRNYNIHQEWLKYFKSVEVVTTSNRHRLQQEVFENLPVVHEAQTFDLRWWMSRNKGQHVHLPEGKKDRAWIRFVQRLIDSFPFNILIGDGGFFYILAAYRKGKKLIQQQQIKYLYSSFRPYSDHIPPFLLKIWKPELFWIADFRDLQVDVNVKNTFAERFQHWCNRRILAKADVITTVSEGLAQHLRRYHSNVYVLRNGIGAATANQKKASPFPKFTIAYTGSMFRQKRDPSLFLQALSKLLDEGKLSPEKVEIRYAGKDGALWDTWITQYQLKPLFLDMGMQPLKVANQLQQQAHINLLLTFSSPEMNGNLTGKLYEYINAQRPILALVNGSQEPELEAILADLEIGAVHYAQDEDPLPQIEAFILKQYKDWLANGDLSFSIQKEKLDNYRWEHLMKNFVLSVLTQSQAEKIS